MRALALCVLLAGCDPGCSAPPSPPNTPAREAGAPRLVSARCAEEAARASVALIPGSGEVDAMSVACRDDVLGVFALRGHVLSWTTRRTQLGAPFARPIVVATGADRLGPTAADAPEGPIAWRSPTANLDTTERDDVWAGMVLSGDGGPRSVRGDALLPAGVVGLGVPFAQASPRGLRAFATVAQQGVAPRTVALELVPGRDEPTRPAALSAGARGQLEAWVPSMNVTLSRVGVDGASVIEARRGEAIVGRHRLPSAEALVLPRGEATAAGAVFAVGAFDVGRGDGGACVGQPGGVCVRPGRLSLLLVPPEGGVRELAVAQRAVPDAIAWDGHALTVLYVEPAEGESTAQRAARVRLPEGRVEALDLAPPQGFPTIDLPRVVRCGDALWLAAAITLEGRAGVTALPLSCVLR